MVAISRLMRAAGCRPYKNDGSADGNRRRDQGPALRGKTVLRMEVGGRQVAAPTRYDGSADGIRTAGVIFYGWIATGNHLFRIASRFPRPTDIYDGAASERNGWEIPSGAFKGWISEVQ